MVKYTPQIVKDYILGNDINDFDIDILEDDTSFMMEVMMSTKDKNMYRYCSDRVKKDYRFVNFLINMFKDDIVFIDAVVDIYLEDMDFTTEKIDFLDIIAQMIEITNGNEDYNLRYQMRALSVYNEFMMSIAMFKTSEKDTEVLRQIGWGFCLLLTFIEGNEKVIDLFVGYFINNMLNFKDFSREVHQRFSSFEELEKYGIDKYILEYLDMFDNNLAYYMMGHKSLFKYFANIYTLIRNDWNYFYSKNEYNRELLLEELLDRYFEKNDFSGTYTNLQILYYVAHELNVEWVAKKYFKMDEKDEEEVKEMLKLDKSAMNLATLKMYYGLKKIIVEVMSLKIVEKDTKVEFDVGGTLKFTNNPS